jgi:anti-sigma factor RsiW
MDHARFEELKDAYVLRALPDEQRREFEEYLAQHPERQAEIEELGGVASLLALSPTNASRPQSLGNESWTW